MKKINILIFCIIILSSCYFPISVTDDNEVVDNYDLEIVYYGGNINIADSDISVYSSDLKIYAVMSATGQFKVTDIDDNGDFSFSFFKRDGARVYIYAFIDDYSGGTTGVYNKPYEKIFVITNTTSEESNTDIDVNDIHVYSGSINDHDDPVWQTNLLAEIYNSTHYIYYYQKLNANDTYDFYFVDNHACYINIGPSSDLNEENENFLKYSAQIYGSQSVTANNTSGSFVIRKIKGTITINDSGGAWSDYPLIIMIGTANWNTQNIELFENTSSGTHPFTIYARNDAALNAWSYIDKNFSGNNQSDEPINGSIGCDTSGADIISGVNFTLTAP